MVCGIQVGLQRGSWPEVSFVFVQRVEDPRDSDTPIKVFYRADITQNGEWGFLENRWHSLKMPRETFLTWLLWWGFGDYSLIRTSFNVRNQLALVTMDSFGYHGFFAIGNSYLNSSFNLWFAWSEWLMLILSDSWWVKHNGLYWNRHTCLWSPCFL